MLSINDTTVRECRRQTNAVNTAHNSSIYSHRVLCFQYSCISSHRISLSKQVYRRRYESRRSSKPKLHKKQKKNKVWRKTIFNMADGIITSCNVTCGSGIMTVNSPSGSTMQCDTWLWDDMPWNSSKRPLYWNSTSGFHFAISPQSTCHSAPNCEILSKSDHPQQKKMTFCRFSRWRISAILDFRGPIMGSLRSSCTTSYRSSINIMALNCLVFEKIAFFSIRRQTDRQTKKHMDTPVA